MIPRYGNLMHTLNMNPLMCLQRTRYVWKVQYTPNPVERKPSEYISIAMGGSESARWSSLASRNKIGSVDTTPNKIECVRRKMGKQENVRDNKHKTNIRFVCNMNVTSAHGMQDDGEGYNEMLNQLSAGDEMRIEG